MVGRMIGTELRAQPTPGATSSLVTFRGVHSDETTFYRGSVLGLGRNRALVDLPV